MYTTARCFHIQYINKSFNMLKNALSNIIYSRRYITLSFINYIKQIIPL